MADAADAGVTPTREALERDLHTLRVRHAEYDGGTGGTPRDVRRMQQELIALGQRIVDTGDPILMVDMAETFLLSNAQVPALRSLHRAAGGRLLRTAIEQTAAGPHPHRDLRHLLDVLADSEGRCVATPEATEFLAGALGDVVARVTVLRPADLAPASGLARRVASDIVHPRDRNAFLHGMMGDDGPDQGLSPERQRDVLVSVGEVGRKTTIGARAWLEISRRGLALSAEDYDLSLLWALRAARDADDPRMQREAWEAAAPRVAQRAGAGDPQALAILRTAPRDLAAPAALRAAAEYQARGLYVSAAGALAVATPKGGTAAVSPLGGALGDAVHSVLVHVPSTHAVEVLARLANGRELRAADGVARAAARQWADLTEAAVATGDPRVLRDVLARRPGGGVVDSRAVFAERLALTAARGKGDMPPGRRADAFSNAVGVMPETSRAVERAHRLARRLPDQGAGKPREAVAKLAARYDQQLAEQARQGRRTALE